MASGVYWLIVISLFMIGLRTLDESIMAGVFSRFFSYLPNLVVAIFIFVIGFMFSKFIARSVLIGAVNAQIRSAKLLSISVELLDHDLHTLTGTRAVGHWQSDHRRHLFDPVWRHCSRAWPLRSALAVDIWPANFSSGASGTRPRRIRKRKNGSRICSSPASFDSRHSRESGNPVIRPHGTTGFPLRGNDQPQSWIPLRISMPSHSTRLRILVAPNAFKESLSAIDAARAIAKGIRRGLPNAQVTEVPIADGGDGTLEAVISGTGGRILKAKGEGPLGNRITAEYGITGDGKTAVIEMSRASGLALVPPARRNPMRTTSFGTGQLIQAALDRGVGRILLGIGGSATVDGGIGALQALGVSFLDRQGKPVGHGGAGLLAIESIELSRPASVTEAY